MRSVVIIPARYKSSRFPGKPLVKLLGKSMIIWVAELSAIAVGRDNVYVATDDERIAKIVTKAGFNIVMTSNECLTGTDRVAEAASKIKSDIYVNVQGDEPLVHPEMFIPLVAPLKKSPSLNCVNLMRVITKEEEYLNQNVVKVVFDMKDNALYFSREPVPSGKMTTAPFDKYKQLGVIAFRKEFLLKLNRIFLIVK